MLIVKLNGKLEFSQFLMLDSDDYFGSWIDQNWLSVFFSNCRQHCTIGYVTNKTGENAKENSKVTSKDSTKGSLWHMLDTAEIEIMSNDFYVNKHGVINFTTGTKGGPFRSLIMINCEVLWCRYFVVFETNLDQNERHFLFMLKKIANANMKVQNCKRIATKSSFLGCDEKYLTVWSSKTLPRIREVIVDDNFHDIPREIKDLLIANAIKFNDLMELITTAARNNPNFGFIVYVFSKWSYIIGNKKIDLVTFVKLLVAYIAFVRTNVFLNMNDLTFYSWVYALIRQGIEVIVSLYFYLSKFVIDRKTRTSRTLVKLLTGFLMELCKTDLFFDTGKISFYLIRKEEGFHCTIVIRIKPKILNNIEKRAEKRIMDETCSNSKNQKVGKILRLSNVAVNDAWYDLFGPFHIFKWLYTKIQSYVCSHDIFQEIFINKITLLRLSRASLCIIIMISCSVLTISRMSLMVDSEWSILDESCDSTGSVGQPSDSENTSNTSGKSKSASIVSDLKVQPNGYKAVYFSDWKKRRKHIINKKIKKKE